MGKSGILEVQLMDAKGLAKTDFLGNMDPYVIVQYKGYEHKSSVARGQGGNPIWNEKFTFRVQYPGVDDGYKLILKILDKDTFSSDDFMGEATIYLKNLIAVGMQNGIAEMHPCKYRVVLADGTYCGEIKVGITFTQENEEEKEKEYGGWKQSTYC